MANARIPEAELIRKTIVLRRMDLPKTVLMTKRSLLRWVALSLGFISEKESRTAGIEVLDSLFYFLFTKNKGVSADELKRFLEEKKGINISERLVRYHLNKIEQAGIIQRKNSLYSVNPAPTSERDDIVASCKYYAGEEFEKTMKNISIALESLSEKYRTG